MMKATQSKKGRTLRRLVPAGLLALVAAGTVLALATWIGIRPMPVLDALAGPAARARLLDRNGRPLTVTFENQWNRFDTAALHRLPPLLVRAFVASEDRRFFDHAGVDWVARFHALWQNLKAGRTVRGASTITEQTVRMLHPRPRTVWARWLEGVEASALEKKNTKAQILEFYLNQVPFAARRRGVVQAADYYFDRDLSTLTEKEVLALAVMVRAPARFQVGKHPAQIARRIEALAQWMVRNRLLDRAGYQRLQGQVLKTESGKPFLEARHFARFVFGRMPGAGGLVHTTLDPVLQRASQDILDERLAALGEKGVDNGALLVADHHSGEILAWVVGRAGEKGRAAVDVDAVQAPRQPGSALKPFVYAMALERGWTAATLIDDSPLSESVGQGLHAYRNYSRVHYGPVSLRQALGNSLNVPAVRAMQFVGATAFLKTLYDLGIQSLDRHPDHYGDGLALGNGEVSLFELVQAYAVLARGGVFTPLAATRDPDGRGRGGERVFSEAVATLVGDILSDAGARRLEFGASALLDLPVQTALKTGTSSDYRDAWAAGFNHRYTVGVWMGNLGGRPMKHVSGATGPALVLRAVFAELCRNQRPEPLPMSPELVKRAVCIGSGRLADDTCPRRDEWFVPGFLPRAEPEGEETDIRIRQPSPGLQMAMDPRMDPQHQAFEFKLNTAKGIEKVDWYLNGRLLASSADPTWAWPVARGSHRLEAHVRLRGEEQWVQTRPVAFVVK